MPAFRGAQSFTGRHRDVAADTAWRGPPGCPPTQRPDPRWQFARGFGALDLYAAKRELESRDRTQVVRLSLEASETQIAAELRTQRERGVSSFDFERAPDVAGSPGAFAVIDAVGAAGDSSLADLTNRQLYPRTWTVPGNERGLPFWYRVAWNEGGVRYTTPARRLVSPTGPSAATIEVTIVHNAYDEDVDATIDVGATGGNPPALSWSLPGSSMSVASDWVTGTSTHGNVAWTFHLEVPSGSANSWLPPSSSAPWWLRVTEGGFLNRSGRITQYRMTVHGSGGDVVYQGGPLPLATIESQTVVATVPSNHVGVGSSSQPARSLRVGPNPASRRGRRFSAAAGAGHEVEIFDLEGRRGSIPFALSGGVRRGIRRCAMHSSRAWRLFAVRRGDVRIVASPAEARKAPPGMDGAFSRSMSQLIVIWCRCRALATAEARPRAPRSEARWTSEASTAPGGISR